MLERERELEALERGMDGLANGAGSLVLVEGPAGIGKSRLLAEAVELARRREVLVRYARGGELEREMTFGVVRQLLDPVVERWSEEQRSRLLSGSAGLALIALGGPAGQAPAPAGDPFAPIHGLYWLVANLADSEPVLLVIDDAHWADAQTLRFLDYLARRIADLPVLVIAGARSGEPDEPADLERLRLQAQLLRPRSLSERAVRELIAAELGAEPSAELAAACARATAGNPFLVTEVARGLRADAVAAERDAASSIAGLGPETVARYVLLRLGRFGKEAIALARAIAVLGGSPQLRHAAKLSGLEDEGAQALCDRLREAEILAPGLPIDFVHPLVRQAIYRDLSEGERSVMHRRAGEVLSSTGAAAGEIAPHVMACAPNGDQWVVAQLGAAAWDAIPAGAFDAAQAYLERALEEPPDDELPFRFALGMSMLQTDLARAPEILRDVAERASDQSMRVEALRYTALAYIFGGEWNEAVGWFEKAVDALPEDDREQRLVAEAHRYCTKAGPVGRDPSDSKRIAAIAADAAGTTQGECLARQALAFDRFLDCAPVDEVVELAASIPPPPWDLTTLAPTLSFGFKVLGWSGSWGPAREVIVRARDWTHEQGLLFGVSYATAFLAEVDRLAGRLADAEAEARTGLEIATEVAPFSDFALQATTNLLVTLIARGDLDEAAQLADGIDLSGGVTEGAVTPWPIEARGYLRLAQGALEGGVQDLLVIGEELMRRGDANPALSPWCQETAPALAALGRTAEAARLIAVAEERALAFGAPHVIGTVLRSKALVASRKQRVEILRDSVTALEAYGPPHELARSLLELGAALRRTGRRSEAREPLRRALALAHHCGAGAVESRAREELRAAGARPRRAMMTGPDALTATEQRIAGMAANGMSNPEIAQALFVTRKTIENHLTRIYPKLGIHSRTQLPEVLADSGSSPDDANWGEASL